MSSEKGKEKAVGTEATPNEHELRQTVMALVKEALAAEKERAPVTGIPDGSGEGHSSSSDTPGTHT